MKTTLMIADPLMRALREKAAREGSTISALVEEAIRNLIQPSSPKKALPSLPRYRMGTLVDVANREELYRVMEEE